METFLPANRQLALRTIAMPADTNPNGDIFGGWLVSQMDLAAGNIAKQRSQGRTVTVAIDRLEFHKRVYVGDEISCYVELVRIGRTSMTLRVEAWAHRLTEGEPFKVTGGTFTFVAIDDDYKPRIVPRD
jgi:acyl-CoA thioesterase YciA